MRGSAQNTTAYEGCWCTKGLAQRFCLLHLSRNKYNKCNLTRVTFKKHLLRRVHYSVDILNVSTHPFIRILHRKKTPLQTARAVNGGFPWLDFVCRTQKKPTIKIDLYSRQTHGGEKVFKSVVMFGNEPLSKLSLVTNPQSALLEDMLVKCQCCHSLSCNYRLACRPFNDHLQYNLQCISVSLNCAHTHTRARKHTPTHTELVLTLLSIFSIHSLFIAQGIVYVQNAK